MPKPRCSDKERIYYWILMTFGTLFTSRKDFFNNSWHSNARRTIKFRKIIIYLAKIK